MDFCLSLSILIIELSYLFQYIWRSSIFDDVFNTILLIILYYTTSCRFQIQNSFKWLTLKFDVMITLIKLPFVNSISTLMFSPLQLIAWKGQINVFNSSCCITWVESIHRTSIYPNIPCDIRVQLRMLILSVLCLLANRWANIMCLPLSFLLFTQKKTKSSYELMMRIIPQLSCCWWSKVFFPLFSCFRCAVDFASCVMSRPIFLLLLLFYFLIIILLTTTIHMLAAKGIFHLVHVRFSDSPNCCVVNLFCQASIMRGFLLLLCRSRSSWSACYICWTHGCIICCSSMPIYCVCWNSPIILKFEWKYQWWS